MSVSATSLTQCLVFFETSGNQAYIYGTNKLRENIGASELTYRAGTQWVLEAAGYENVPTGSPANFRKWLVEHGESSNKGGVEVVLSTSGKSMLVVSGTERAKQIVTAVTRRAANEAPGLSITGAIVELAGRDDTSVAKAMQAAHERFNANRDMMPVPAQRFQMLPFCEPCATSGLPARSCDNSSNNYLSAPAEMKRGATDKWFARIRRVFRNSPKDGLFIALSADQVEREFAKLSWLGVAFSDGNGLGQIMMRFKEWLAKIREEDKDYPEYLTTLRNFSIELDAATESAFYTACKKIDALGSSKKLPRKKGRPPRRLLPIVPLLLGGDDLTVLVDGRYALPFTQAFLEAFEIETAKEKSPTIARIAEKALGAGRLSAGAGVAIVKKHFPFHSAHGLAESLLKSAKLTKKKVQQQTKEEAFPCSSLDFHILFDAAYSGLDDIRESRRKGKEGEHLWGGPYVVTPIDMLADARDTGWAVTHHLECLRKRVDVLNARDDEGRLKLPSSQMHALREALAQGKVVADERLKEMAWLKQSGLTVLHDGDASLFFAEEGKLATRFLDALSSAEFWPTGNTNEQAEAGQ